MTAPKTHFVIPTYRLRDVGETVEAYDDNFSRCGQSVPITVFDDSSIANHQKYYDTLEATRTQNEVWYVGPTEQEQFLGRAPPSPRSLRGGRQCLVRSMIATRAIANHWKARRFDPAGCELTSTRWWQPNAQVDRATSCATACSRP